jgi:hypothetical protein
MLVSLSLWGNNLSGGIPEWIGSLNLLEHLNLGENIFSGELPIGICDLANLKDLWLRNNQIEGISLLTPGSIPACIGALINLSYIDLLGNIMSGTVPESIGKLVLLKELNLGYGTNTNMFVGPLPSSMSNLILLEDLYLNVETLNGTLPDFSRATLLAYCAFTPSQMCYLPHLVPVGSKCDYSGLPFCKIPDCEILEEWLPKLFDSYTCCQVDGVTCGVDRVVILDLSSIKTGIKISGNIPLSIGELDNLQQLYLQENFLEGNLPLSLSDISSLQKVNITNNLLSGVLPFHPSFELIGTASNWDLSLPFSPTIITESP